MFTNFTCSSYLIIWHIKIQLNHWQWHNNQWIQSESEIHNQKYHCATILHLSTGTNTCFCICVHKKWNSPKLMNDQKNCQLSKTSNTGPKVGVRVHPTGVKEQVWQKQQQKTLVWLTHQRRQQPQVSNCCPICFTSQFDDHQMPGGLNKGYTR